MKENNTRWTERKTIVYELENIPLNFDDNIYPFDYSQLQIKVPWQVKYVDVGSWCYTKRKPKHANSNHADYATSLVNVSSFKKCRISAIKGFVEYLHSRYSTGITPKTLHRYTSSFNQFLVWCDSNQQEDVLNTIMTARKSLAEYIITLFHLTRSSQLNINTAARYQNHIIEILKFIFDDDEGVISAGLRIIRKSETATIATPVPGHSKAHQSIELYLSLFNQITDFVLSFEKYPFQLTLPEETLWVFPTTRPMATKSKLKNRNEWAIGFWSWDYENGCLSKVKNIEKFYSGDKKQKRDASRYIMKSSQKVLAKVNADNNHYYRRRLAYLASDAFTMLFISNTAMNLAQLITLNWSEDYSVGKEHQGYRAIKLRAGNKSQHFIVTSSFLPLFKKYLKLRKYLLVEDSSLLFFGFDASIINHKPLSKGFTTNFNQKLRNNIGIDIPTITAREWRAHKADWLITKTDSKTTAMMLQNSERTVLKHYTTGSEIESANEMSKFYDSLSTIQFNTSSDKKSQYTSVPIGQCQQFQDPKVIDAKNNVLPNCSAPSGCLNCSHYRIIADEEDIRKLVSFRYISVESRQLASSETHFENYFGKMLTRIDEILMSLRSQNKKLKLLVDRICSEVSEQEILSPYWDRKYQLLINLELIK
jgi:hypothetical protein